MADGTAYSADSLQVVVDKETETLRDTVETTKHMREILQEQSQVRHQTSSLSDYVTELWNILELCNTTMW